MTYDIFRVDDSANRTRMAPGALGEISGPSVLFMGGLFHLAGYENGRALGTLLQGLARLPDGRQADTYFIQELKETPWDEKIHDCFVFEKTGKPSASAHELARAVFTTLARLAALKEPSTREDALSAIRTHFSLLTVIGYSYGTSLIRQIETVIRSDLRQAGLSEDEIGDAMDCLAVLDLGPTYTFPRGEPTAAHAVTVSRNDMMTRELSGFVYPAPNPDGHSVTAKVAGNSLIMVPETGTATSRAVIEKAGEKPSLRYDVFEEAHSLLMYLNVAGSVHEADKTIRTFASLPTASLARKFCAMAVDASAESAKDKTQRSGHKLLAEFQARNLTPERLDELDRSFRTEDEYFLNEIACGAAPAVQKSFWKKPAFMNS